MREERGDEGRKEGMDGVTKKERENENESKRQRQIQKKKERRQRGTEKEQKTNFLRACIAE